MNDTWMERAKLQMRVLGVSQETLAAALGYSRGAVGHYLNGRRMPSLKQLETIAKTLNVDMLWLLYGDRETNLREDTPAYHNNSCLIPVTGNTRNGFRRKPVAHLAIPAPIKKYYAFIVSNNDNSPRIYEEEILLIDPDTKPSPGDEVLVHDSNDQIKLHTYINTKRDAYILDSIVGKKDRRALKIKDLKSMHRIVAVFRASELLVE